MTERSVSLEEARAVADAVWTQMCSSIAVHRLSRAERMQRLRLSKSIIDKIDEDPAGAKLSPKEWRFIYDTLRAQDEMEAATYDEDE
jgi:hypothetical protein